MKRLATVESLLWLALALALAGSVKHLANVFASIDGNHFLGWLQAIAIDAGVFALAYQIRVRKTEQRATKRLWAGVVTFTVISVYGNLTYGLQSLNGSLPWWIQVSKPVVLAATLPGLVLFLAELLGDDRERQRQQAQPKPKRERKPKAAQPAKAQPAGDTREQARAIMEAEPGIGKSELGRRLGKSAAYGRKLYNELQPEISTNGSNHK